MTYESVTYFIIYIFYGLLIGSFLNVCIYRIPKEISVVRGRSFCPSCNHPLYPLDLVPVFSYLFLGRRCRYCKEPISSRYASIEGLTGLVFGIVYLRYGLTFNSVLVCLFACILITLSFIDLDTQEIPDRFHVFIVGLAILNFFVEPTFSFSDKLLGALVISLPMLVIAALTGGFGGGDIKLLVAVGLFMGVGSTIVSFFLGAFFGALYGIYLMIFKKAKGKTAFSFGPFLSMGIFIGCLYGQEIISFYLSFYH